MTTNELDSTILSLFAPAKGILAADDSLGTIAKRFAEAGIASTAESRSAYRELLFSTPDIGKAISGVILFDETVRRETIPGVSQSTILTSQGIVAGITARRRGASIRLALDGPDESAAVLHGVHR